MKLVQRKVLCFVSFVSQIKKLQFFTSDQSFFTFSTPQMKNSKLYFFAFSDITFMEAHRGMNFVDKNVEAEIYVLLTFSRTS